MPPAELLVPVNALAAVAVAALVGTLAEAIRRRSLPATVNAVGAVAIALLPTLLVPFTAAHHGWSLTVDPLLTLWLAVAGVLHSIGMLGLYESVWWWDHLTHTLSATLVAALVYAALLVAGSGFAVPVGVATVSTTFAVGVFWELVELVAREVGKYLDVEPVLVYYGWQDTAFDLVFDLVGAGIVVAFGVRLFVPLAEEFPDTTRTLLVWSGGAVVVGSLVAVVGIGLARWSRMAA